MNRTRLLTDLASYGVKRNINTHRSCTHSARPQRGHTYGPIGRGAERLEYVAAAVADIQRENLLGIAASMDAGFMRSMDPRTLAIVISIGLSCTSSAKMATNILYDVNLQDKDARENLTKEISLTSCFLGYFHATR